jgi:RHS repeat-associated protein
MRFSSMPYYERAGIVGYAFRHYDPVLQRWLNEDPIGEAGGINLHGFVSNNPINNVDPDGLLFKEFFSKLGHSLWELMMGPRPETPPNSDMNMVALYGELGGIDRDNNVLSDSITGGVGMVGDVATDYVAAEAGVKLLGAAAGAVCRASKIVTPSSRALGFALENAGFVRRTGEAAHHIVAGSAEAAGPARAVLQRFGISINEAANGVFLPGNLAAENAAAASVHSTIHTVDYYATVNKLLLGATTREEAVTALSAVRNALLGGGL